MKKSDLKPNHIVEFRNNDNDLWKNVNQDGYSDELNYDLNELNYDLNKYDIMKVYEFGECIWEREEDELVSYDELEELNNELKKFAKAVNELAQVIKKIKGGK